MTSLPALASHNYEVASFNHSIPSPHEMAVFETIALQAVTSKMYRGIGDQAGVLMIMLSARELGIPPMAALNGGIAIISGKVEVAARTMSAMIRRGGHSIREVTSTDTECTLTGTRRDNGDTITVTYTIQDAQKAGLVRSGGGWTKFPSDMLFARALSRLARRLFSDVIGMAYIEGEIKDAQEPINSRPLPALAPDDKVIAIEALQEHHDRFKAFVEENIANEPEDMRLFFEYFAAVQNNFGWNVEKTKQEFYNNKEKTIEGFNTWKKKQQS